jgi:hypothetical protein
LAYLFCDRQSLSHCALIWIADEFYRGDRFESDFLGLQARQDFRVINLWEVDAEIVFEQSLDTLLPFVPVLKNGGMSKRSEGAWCSYRRMSNWLS